MDYKIGDKVVYPNHGVGIVEQISYGVLNGITDRYFMIRIVSSGLPVLLHDPALSAHAVLHALISLYLVLSLSLAVLVDGAVHRPRRASSCEMAAGSRGASPACAVSLRRYMDFLLF